MNVNICCFSETWLHSSDKVKFAEMKDLGFTIHSKPRAGRGGGVGILLNNNILFTPCKTKLFKTFECCECTFKVNTGELIRISCVYRSGTNTSASSNIPLFLEDFEDYLNSFVEKPGKPIIMGDFNIHVEDSNCSTARKFIDLLEELDWVQHINVPTHIKGGTLDLVISKKKGTSDFIDLKSFNVLSSTGTTSDHFLVTFQCDITAFNKKSPAIQPYRKINAIDIDDFKSDILLSSLCDANSYSSKVDKIIQLYNSELAKILNKHAPLKWFTPKARSSGWWNSTCQQARTMRRCAERKKKHGDATSLENYKQCCKQASDIINEQRTMFFNDKLKECKDNPKKTFSLVDKLLDKSNNVSIFPTSESDLKNAESFKDFFHSKITAIYDEISKNRISSHHVTYENVSQNHQPTMSCFKPISEPCLVQIIKDLSSKHCDLDPVPTKLLLQCLPELIPLILHIVNHSLTTGIFPGDLKEALIRPSIKSEDLDREILKNYRPISNLPFLSKVIEKCVAIQLNDYLEENNLISKFQSGYRKYHSCETATTRIFNDILVMCDKRSKVVLLLLDLSAAFDTVNHKMLIKKLKDIYGLSGTVLKWFISYLDKRSFTVKVHSSRSGRCCFSIGVPQGSILGPILFILYTKELENIAKYHGFDIHIYADDTQLYFTFDSDDQSNIEFRAMTCMQEIKKWMLQNFLQLNDSKTEIMIVSPKSDSSTSASSFQAIKGCKPLDVESCVKSLGVRLDSKLTMSYFISATVAASNIKLRNLWNMATKLPFKLKIQLVHAMVLSKLDFCNSVLYGISEKDLHRLQKIQNSAVRFIFTKSKRSHVSPLLKMVHFLPVRFRILYKINMLIYKCINNIAPAYLQDLVHLRVPNSHGVRLDDDFFMLETPPTPNFTSTMKAFSYCSPLIWNLLPYELRCCENINQFKSKLKTYYFEIAFND